MNPVPVISVDRRRRATSCGRRTRDPQQVVDPQIASVADDILQQVVLYGTGKAANIGRPQIGKTGTADTHTNAWFVGAVPQLVTVGVGRVPRGPDPDAAAHDADHRLRRHVAGADLAHVHAAGDRRACRAATSPRPEVGYMSVRRRRDARIPYCLPNPYTLPQQHPDPAVHRGHRADEGVQDTRPPSQSVTGALGDRA